MGKEKNTECGSDLIMGYWGSEEFSFITSPGESNFILRNVHCKDMGPSMQHSVSGRICSVR